MRTQPNCTVLGKAPLIRGGKPLKPLNLSICYMLLAVELTSMASFISTLEGLLIRLYQIGALNIHVLSQLGKDTLQFVRERSLF